MLSVSELIVLPKNQHMNQYIYLEFLCGNLPDVFDKCGALVFGIYAG